TSFCRDADTIYLGWSAISAFRKPASRSGANAGRFMTGFQALTEKEKQALRLLAGGHDAKSMAQHLGLSVHTVNERLRGARRKMSVSSSREAARQLRDHERGDPENLGDMSLGDATGAPGMEQPRASAEARRMPRRAGWIVGAIIMSVGLALFALASLSGSA